MATNRKTIFANDEIYHIFNRGVEKRPTFTSRREYARAVKTFSYYRFVKPPYRFSHFVRLAKDIQSSVLKNLNISAKHIEILAFCLIPNHFHFLLRQVAENGISKFAANFTNSYTKYFNTLNDRVGPLFQGAFKAVHIESDEQLMHVSRYIHLNPVSSFIIEADELDEYEWSSYPGYISKEESSVVEKHTVLELFSNKIERYKQFVLDYADYSRKLGNIKHLILD